MALPAACETARTVAECLNAPTTPTLAQYGADIPAAAAHMVGAFLDGGPGYWLALLLVLWVLGKVLGFVLLLIAGPKERT